MGFRCFSGNDADLQYWYECLTCGCIVVEDRSNPACLESWTCPSCNNLKDFPFRYFTKKEMDECPAIKSVVDTYKKLGFPS